MKDFIRADFYRLMHSKGFWITEFALFCVISLGTLFQSNIRFGANISNHETATPALGKLTGLQALNYFADNTDSLFFFTIIIISMVLGVDLSRKLYKNCLSYGISKLSYYLSKFFVCVSIALLHLLFIQAISFATASLSTELEVHLATFGVSWELLSSFNFSVPSLGLVSSLWSFMPVTLSYLAF